MPPPHNIDGMMIKLLFPDIKKTKQILLGEPLIKEGLTRLSRRETLVQ